MYVDVDDIVIEERHEQHDEFSYAQVSRAYRLLLHYVQKRRMDL